MNLYSVDYSKPSSTVKLYKYDIPLPEMPPLKEMENYGLPIEQQKFKKTIIPASIRKYKSNLTEEEELFIKREHHKRRNGVWVIIKGLPIYITGPYYWFLNYWTMSSNDDQPGFRYIQCLIFLFWDMVVRDQNCYGAFLVGPRRIGKTEFTLAMHLEYISRVRSVRGGMQSKNDVAAEENFDRITYANKNLIWFMKPIHKGSEQPTEKLEYMYPSPVVTDKKIKAMAANSEDDEDVYTEKEMNSWLDYQPSIAGAYDRVELNRWIINEAGKLEKMSLIKNWDKVKPCLHYDHGKTIIGKGWGETTIEEVNDEQIEEVNEFFRDSNPEERDDNGRTITGMYHLFIPHDEAYNEDEWGFSRKEEAEIFLQNQINQLKKKKKYSKITDLLRKTPRTIEDALTPSGSQSAFNKDRLTEILKRIDFPETYGFEQKEWTVRGNFIWANGMPDTRVIFVPDEEGKFEVSQLLKDGQDNNVIFLGGMRLPGNLRKFRGGCDPYEHSEVVDQSRASKGAGVIMKMFDDNEDGAKIEDGAPIDFGWEWLSKQIVCDYLAREDDPDVFFEDMLMMHVYYGTQMNVENNKQAIKKHFRQRGYAEFLMARPETTMDEKSRYSTTNQIGTPATTDTIDQYFMAIAHYVMMYANALKHRRVILQLLEGNKKNRTKLDSMVAFGWALIACEKQFSRLPEHEIVSEEDQWFTLTSV